MCIRDRDNCGPHGENVVFPPRCEVVVDVFSCRKLDAELRIGVTTSKGEEVFEDIFVVTVVAEGGVHSPAAEAATAN